jgi:hypothetical protein
MAIKKNPQGNSINESEGKKDAIVKLIDWIEKNQKQMIRRRDAFYHMGWLLLLLAVVILGIPGSLFFINVNIPERIIVLLSAVAILLAFLTLVTQISERNVVEARMNHALQIRPFDEYEKPLLKAFLKIKSKNPEQKLSELFLMDRKCGGEIFTEKGLLRILFN